MIDNQYIDLIIDKYFKKENIFVSHQIDSYNDLIDNILPNILEQFFPIIINVKDKTIIINTIEIYIKNIRYKNTDCVEMNGVKKTMTPFIAKLRNYTYSLSIYIDILIKIKINEDGSFIYIPDKLMENILLGRIPIVVKSKYCILSSLCSTPSSKTFS